MENERSAERSGVPIENIGDESLALAYSDGDENAAVPLFRRYEKPLWKYALRTSVYRDRSFLDDIVQITLVLIFRLLKDKQFTPRFVGSFKAWAFDICKKVIYNENQKRLRQDIPTTDDYLTDLSMDIALRRGADSMEAIRNEEKRAKLEKALQRLKPVQRKLIELRFAGKSYEQIIKHEPEFSGKKTGQLRVKYCRILERLRKDIKEGNI